MKFVRLIKMCLSQTFSKVLVGKHLSDSFPIQNGLKQGDALSLLLFIFTLGYDIKKVQDNQVGHISFWLILMVRIYWERPVQKVSGLRPGKEILYLGDYNT
jgi:hypothetical protein